MAKPEVDKPVEGDDLSPVTVKVGEDGDDDNDQDDTDDQKEPAAAAREDGDRMPPQRAGNGQGLPGQRAPGQQRPSKNAYLQKQITQATAPHLEKIAALERQIAEMTGRFDVLSRMGQGQQQDAGQQKQQQEIQTITNEMNTLVVQASDPNLTEAQRQSLVARHQQLNDRRNDLLDEAKWEKRKAEWQKEQDQGREAPQVAAARAILTSEFPAIAENQEASAQAKAYYQYLVAKNGGRESIGLLRQACAQVQRDLGLGPRPGPSDMERAASQGASGSSGQRGSGEVTFSRDDLRVMRGAPVSPQQVAEQMRRMQAGED